MDVKRLRIHFQFVKILVLSELLYTRCLKKWATFIFAITSVKVDQISSFFTVKFRKDLLRKMELKLPSPLKSVATLCTL